MASYIQILADGTRREVQYNPKHDGPVSERITLLKKVKYFLRQSRLRPADQEAKDGLRRAQRLLNEHDDRFSTKSHRTRQPEKRLVAFIEKR